jgi:hypothetical protein
MGTLRGTLRHDVDFSPVTSSSVAFGAVRRGPLGFAKLIVASGAFDRCVVRQLHKAIIGRDVDPAREAGYLDALTTRFVDDGRRVRPLVRHLIASDLFQRGL